MIKTIKCACQIRLQAAKDDAGVYFGEDFNNDVHIFVTIARAGLAGAEGLPLYQEASCQVDDLLRELGAES